MGEFLYVVVSRDQVGEGMTGEHEGDARGGQGFNAENKLKNYKNK